jgi:hypothetical protein
MLNEDEQKMYRTKRIGRTQITSRLWIPSKLNTDFHPSTSNNIIFKWEKNHQTQIEFKIYSDDEYNPMDVESE